MDTFSETRKQIIILDEFVEMTWVGKAAHYYMGLGYEYTGNLTKFLCRVCDLPSGSNKKVRVMCPICGKERSVWYQDISLWGHSMCRGCAKIIDLRGMRFGRLVAIDLDTNRKHHWICKCDCGNTKSISSVALIHNRTVSCGCYHREIMSSICGENHYNWDSELTKEHREKRRNDSRKRPWTNAVFNRDGYTCQRCGQIRGKIQAHHLYDYTSYPEYRYDINNGVTLCKSCHDEFHIWMGGHRVSCTPHHFQEWLYLHA